MLVLLAPATSVAADDLVLQAREQRPWNLPADLERVAIADPGVADIVMLRGQRQALLVGRMPGTTTLLLWPAASTGWLYPAVAAVCGAVFLYEAVALLQRARAGKRDAELKAMRLFHWSNTYLALVFLAVAIDPLVF